MIPRSAFTGRKDLERRLGDPVIILNSFIISNTPYAKVAFWEQQFGMDKAEFERRHVLFQKDDQTTYIQNMFHLIQEAVLPA